ncbi:hypothetical protein NONO_c73350 [Nocardia nova SH22a]|uniref:Uncharacterized protein n=1 Tax=Nocardia nova SH22a TaxID=1415166 RepID=W5TXY9_9NOCA|nr:hypothetical protein [Nocardia nova]AHH22091.1 hypothetical protein NONO_c73350 [Nocardia nova SH22a]
MKHDAHVLAYRLEVLRQYLDAIGAALGVPVVLSGLADDVTHAVLAQAAA